MKQRQQRRGPIGLRRSGARRGRKVERIVRMIHDDGTVVVRGESWADLLGELAATQKVMEIDLREPYDDDYDRMRGTLSTSAKRRLLKVHTHRVGNTLKVLVDP